MPSAPRWPTYASPRPTTGAVSVMKEFALPGEYLFEGDLTALSVRTAATPVDPPRSTHRFSVQGQDAHLVLGL